MNEYLSSFLISLGAGLVTPLFQQQSDKSVEKSLDRYFHEALWDWTAEDENRKTHYPIESYQDLLKYLGEDGTPRDPELVELIVCWQNKLMADPATAAFLTNFKLDKLVADADKANHKLDTIDSNVISVGCQIETVGHQIQDVDGKIENVAGQVGNVDKNIALIGTELEGVQEKIDAVIRKFNDTFPTSYPDTTGLTFREKKDIVTLTVLMEAFSFDLLYNFCREYPNYIDVDVVGCYDVWSAFIERPTFRIFNPDLRKVINDFYTSWKELIDFGVLYYSSDGIPDKYKFHGLRGDMFINDDVENVFDKLTEMRLNLYPKLKDMADYIMDHYDLDLDTLAMKFFRQ